jgi:hypothetical protein
MARKKAGAPSSRTEPATGTTPRITLSRLWRIFNAVAKAERRLQELIIERTERRSLPASRQERRLSGFLELNTLAAREARDGRVADLEETKQLPEVKRLREYLISREQEPTADGLVWLLQEIRRSHRELTAEQLVDLGIDEALELLARTVPSPREADDGKKLPPSRRTAFKQYQLAVSSGTLASNPTDREAYDWCTGHNDGDPLPRFETWARYLREARRAHGTQKHTPGKPTPTGHTIVGQDRRDQA